MLQVIYLHEEAYKTLTCGSFFMKKDKEGPRLPTNSMALGLQLHQEGIRLR